MGNCFAGCAGILIALAKHPVYVLMRLIKTKQGVPGSLWKYVEAWNWQVGLFFPITEEVNVQKGASEGQARGLIDLLAARRTGLPSFDSRSCCLLVSLKMCLRNKVCPQSFHLHRKPWKFTPELVKITDLSLCVIFYPSRHFKVTSSVPLSRFCIFPSCVYAFGCSLGEWDLFIAMWRGACLVSWGDSELPHYWKMPVSQL